MERFSLTTRMTLRRFTRLTNGHSKKTRNYDTMLGLYFAWYNIQDDSVIQHLHTADQGWESGAVKFEDD